MGGCPFHSSDDDTDRRSSEDDDGEEQSRGVGLDRREFVKSALVIGGASAVTGLGSVAGITPTVRAADSEPITAAARRNRQHAWDSFEPMVSTGHSLHPAHSLVLGLDYRPEGEPRPGHRRQVETALAEIERHFEWHADGVLFTVGYSGAYFDRFEEDPPEGAAPTPPEEVAAISESITNDEDVTGDDHDAVLVLSSNNEANLLAVEAALWGEDNGLDVEFEATFEGVFEKPQSFPDRRIGFGGEAFQERSDEYPDAVPEYVGEEAPLSMGFAAGFDSSIPHEDAVTLVEGQQFPSPVVDEDDVPDRHYVGETGERDPGVFAQGTLHHLAHVEIDLAGWYDKDIDERRHAMYSPYHTEAETGRVGKGLLDDGAPHDPDDSEDPGAEQTVADDDVPDLVMRDEAGSDLAETTQRTAEEGTELTDYDGDGAGVSTVAHGQKCARARIDLDGDDDLEQIVLRRDWDSLIEGDDGNRAGYHFYSPMRFNEFMFNVLESMYGVEFDSLDGRISHEGVDDIETVENGIAEFMSATHRGNFLMPPISLRALPRPRAETVEIESVRREGDEFVVTVETDDDRGRDDDDNGRRGRGGDRIDPETIRFGRSELVNQARGASVDDVSRRGDRLVCRFDADESGIESGDERVKLFCKRRGSRRAVVGTAKVDD